MIGAARIARLLASIAFALGATHAFAQSYPTQPVRLVAPYTAGGPVDIVARLVAKPLADAFKQPVLVDNRTGAGGIIGADAVVKSAPDGHMLLVNTVAMLIAPMVGQKLPFDPVHDLVPLVKIAYVPALLIVSPSLEVRSVADLVALARAKPGSINFASPGQGTSLQLASELFAKRAGIQLVHVPFRGGNEALPRIVAGEVQMMFDPIAEAMPLVKAGRLRALAVSTKERSPLVPDLPTVAESGVPGYDFSVWYGLYAPAKTPPAVLDRIATETLRVLAQPETREQFGAKGFTIVAEGPQAFGQSYLAEQKLWADLIASAGIKAQ